MPFLRTPGNTGGRTEKLRRPANGKQAKGGSWLSLLCPDNRCMPGFFIRRSGFLYSASSEISTISAKLPSMSSSRSKVMVMLAGSPAEDWEREKFL